MSSPAPAALQTESANAFLFTSHSGKTKVTYYPAAPGPLQQGVPRGALLEYAGPEGNLSFRSEQISKQETPAGQLLSVVLRPQFDTGSTAFSLFLPAVRMGDTNSQAFTTYAIKTHHVGFVVTPGAQMTYEVECLNGQAKVEMMPQAVGSTR